MEFATRVPFSIEFPNNLLAYSVAANNANGGYEETAAVGGYSKTYLDIVLNCIGPESALSGRYIAIGL